MKKAPPPKKRRFQAGYSIQLIKLSIPLGRVFVSAASLL